MRALTLHQPWAWLVALGVKTIETRSWSTSYRGPLAIHAGAATVHSGHFLLLARRARSAGAITAEQEAAFRAKAVPFGAVVATCSLVDVVPTNRVLFGEADGWSGDRKRLTVLPSQRPYGDFAPGRYAWLLTEVRALPEPIPARGRQGLWTPAPELVAAIGAAA